MLWLGLLVLSAAVTSPIARIVQLLNDLRVQVTREGEEEKALYDKFMCWCDTGQKEGEASLATQKERIERLAPAIAEAQQRVDQLVDQIHESDKELAAHTQARNTAAAIREKEHTQYEEDTGVLRKSLAGLDKALQVMQKAQDSAVLAQVGPSLLSALTPFLHDARVRTIMDDREVQQLLSDSRSFLQVRDTSPASSHVIGVLQGLRDAFAQDLSDNEKRESEAAAANDALTQSKTAELLAVQETLRQLVQEKTALNSELARNRDDLAATQVSYAQDDAAHKERVTACKTKTGEFHERQQARLSELLAITEATQVLSENQHVLSKAQAGAAGQGSAQANPVPCPVPLECPVSFLQLTPATKAPSDVLHYLETLSKANPDNKMLGLLAMKLNSMSGQSFDRVIQVIRKQIEIIDMEQGQDNAKKKWCVEEEAKTVSAIQLKEQEGKDVKVQLGAVEGELTQLKGEAGELTSAVAELDAQVGDATRNRADEARVFDQTIAELKTAQRALVKAIQVLEAFYGQQAAEQEALVQEQRARAAEAAREVIPGAGEAPSTPSGAYEGSAAGSKILQLLAMVGEDLVHQEEVSREEEKGAQKELATFQQQTALARKMKSEQLMSRREQMARLEQAALGLEGDVEEAGAAQKALQERRIDLAQSCGIVQQYEKRREMRAAERDAMGKAISILS